MEINITKLFDDAAGDRGRYSASCAELGQNAGQITWNNAEACAGEHTEILDTGKKRQAAREHFASFGAWEHEEIMNWSNVELTALIVQLVMGDLRELEAYTDECEPREILRATEDNQDVGGHLFIGTDNEIYYYLGD